MKKIIFCIISSFILYSCESILELEPQSSLSEATFWRTEKDLNAAVNGIYNTLLFERTTEYGMFDTMSDIAASRTVSIWNGVSSGVFDSNNNIISARWQKHYAGIVRANDVLLNIGNFELDQQLINERMGEALFLRAYFYFYLIYLYGDVPLVLDVPTMENAMMPRTSKDVIFAKMIEDLDEAIKLLPQNPSEVGRAAKGAALTLKAKYYMQESMYAEAIPLLEEIMNLGYTLFNNYRTLFLEEGENNPEVIFDIQFTAQTGKGQGNEFNTMYGVQSFAFGWSWLLPTKQLVEMYENKEDGLPDPDPMFNKKDPRMDMTIIRPGATLIDKLDRVRVYPKQVQNAVHSQTGMHPRKYIIEGSHSYTQFDSPQNWIIYRYADVLLMYAEALNEVSGGVPGVYDAINKVRQRVSVDMPIIESGKTKEELREIIRRERGVELALEGWRYFDLKRWGLLKEVNNGFKVINISNGNTILTRIFEDKHELWPIPLTELDRNPELTQNPGY